MNRGRGDRAHRRSGAGVKLSSVEAAVPAAKAGRTPEARRDRGYFCRKGVMASRVAAMAVSSGTSNFLVPLTSTANAPQCPSARRA